MEGFEGKRKSQAHAGGGQSFGVSEMKTNTSNCVRSGFVIPALPDVPLDPIHHHKISGYKFSLFAERGYV